MGIDLLSGDAFDTPQLISIDQAFLTSTVLHKLTEVRVSQFLEELVTMASVAGDHFYHVAEALHGLPVSFVVEACYSKEVDHVETPLHKNEAAFPFLLDELLHIFSNVRVQFFQ